MRSDLVGVAALVVAILVPRAAAASAARPYAPKIPPGYSSKVVLHVDFGTTPDKIGVEWGDSGAIHGDEQEYVEPASATNMRVVGDRFYFIDAAANRIKQFRSPGRLAWQSEPFFNLGYYAVAPDGRVYVVWGTGLEKLSGLDSRGQTVWTVTSHDLFAEQELREFRVGGMTSILGEPEWTAYGLAIADMDGFDRYGKPRAFAVVVDDGGRVIRIVPGRLVGSDGTIYDYEVSNQPKAWLTTPLVGRNLAGKVVRQVRLDFQADNRRHLAGVRAVGRERADPAGGFVVESHAHLPARVKVTSRFDTILEEVLWRFDVRGRFKEQWRFLSGPFASRASQVVVGSDGNVYHLRFGETGIDVVKYSRTKK
jgi:hypothetical protein